MVSNWSLARRRPALEGRARIIQAIRQFFFQEGFLEVETPLRIPAPAPEYHIKAIPSLDWFLHTSPELCMKRLLAADFDRIFQICHCWRDEERGTRHLPEFTMLEWYQSDTDYTDLMSGCERLLIKVAETTGQSSQIIYKGKEISLETPWERLTVSEAFSKLGGVSMADALESGRFDEIMVEAIEPCLGIVKPTFLCDYPAERAALARLKKNDHSVAERFELYIGGLELANGFSELTDACEQRRRFKQEEELRRANGCHPYPEPTRFLQELPSMPPSAGIALGVDRLVMVMLNADDINEVVAFTPEEL
jgi:lysyl-tRNA synthetase class 2